MIATEGVAGDRFSVIDIQANNVVLDLNGFKLGGLAAGPGTQTIGIFTFNRRNITIKNGSLATRFGLALSSGSTLRPIPMICLASDYARRRSK